jgi:signal transduction histidine kinase
MNEILRSLLDWALAASSMFNTLVLGWLGLTVLLNAERGQSAGESRVRRAGGTVLAGSGLLLGAAFFAGQTATLDYPIGDLVGHLRLWWYPAWLAVIALPLGWYALMLWYVGAWEPGAALIARRQRRRLLVLSAFAIALCVLLTMVNPFRVIQQMVRLEDVRAISGWPLLIVAYPPWVLACLIFSISALRRTGENPGAFGALGDLARRRARPYLVASSVLLLCVSLLVAGALAWTVAQLFRLRTGPDLPNLLFAVDAVDLVATSLIALAMVLLGKAIVSYELFTGKVLPRRGFGRQWRSFVVVAASYSVLVSLAWALPLRTVWPLLLTSLLLAASHALFSWRAQAERDDYIDHLRPFVASQNLYGHLLSHAPGLDEGEGNTPDLNGMAPGGAPGGAPAQFRALCEGVLNARVAHLVPLGPMAPLAGAPLSHRPRGAELREEPQVLAGDSSTESFSAPSGAPLNALAARFSSPRESCLAVDPSQMGGAAWAVPLWGERGVIGVLLLGERRDGALYSQEEIEIARASGERLLDAQAGAEVAGRLIALQRRRGAEGQLIDRRARRVLHDDILPQLHAAMLAIAPTPENSAAVEQLAHVHRGISQLLREMPLSTTPTWGRRGLVGALREAVAYEFESAFDRVEWHIEPGAEDKARALPPLTGETLFYAAREAVRNAARYARASTSPHDEAGGIEHERPLTLRISVRCGDGLALEVEDDGVGLPASTSASTSAGAASSTESSGGSGAGLALHSTLLAVVGGALSVESESNRFTRVTLSLPASALLAADQEEENGEHAESFDDDVLPNGTVVDSQGFKSSMTKLR